MNLIKEYKKEIGIGILVTVLMTKIVDPILNFLGTLLISGTSSLSEAYLNRLYSEIAASETNYSFVLLVCLLSAVVIKGLYKTRLSKVENQSNISAAPLFQYLIVLERIYVIFVLVAFTADGFVRIRTKTLFEQRLAIISPILENLEILKFKARYASMNNRADYLKILADMDLTAEKHSISLPRSKLYYSQAKSF